MSAREVRFQAVDGWPLAATLFLPPEERPAGRAVVVGPGVGVPRSFYHRFARRLAARGLRVLTLDWRGIGGSASGPARRCPARLADWGEKDLPAALDWLRDEAGSPSVAYVGHSIAGALLGLAPGAERFERILLVGAQSGYWRLWNGPSGLVIRAIWSAGIPAAVALFGCLPGWTMGGRCDLPPRVAAEWACWGRHPRHVLRHAPEVRERFARLSAAVRAYTITDDWFAPRRAADTVSSYFESAMVERIRVAPEDLGVERIGHFGFFRAELAGSLWEPAADWLAARSAPRSPP